MYDGAKCTFGTMRYVQDVRVLMQKERAAALDLSLHVGRDKLDDVVVKKQNFLYPEDKLIANTQESDVQRQLRACLKDLKLDVGWSVANGQKLVSRADADVFLSGFYELHSATQVVRMPARVRGPEHFRRPHVRQVHGHSQLRERVSHFLRERDTHHVSTGPARLTVEGRTCTRTHTNYASSFFNEGPLAL